MFECNSGKSREFGAILLENDQCQVPRSDDAVRSARSAILFYRGIAGPPIEGRELTPSMQFLIGD
jgi:hypothetical protein